MKKTIKLLLIILATLFYEICAWLCFLPVCITLLCIKIWEYAFDIEEELKEGTTFLELFIPIYSSYTAFKKMRRGENIFL
jgi:hypothetical protein